MKDAANLEQALSLCISLLDMKEVLNNISLDDVEIRHNIIRDIEGTSVCLEQILRNDESALFALHSFFVKGDGHLFAKELVDRKMYEKREVRKTVLDPTPFEMQVW